MSVSIFGNRLSTGIDGEGDSVHGGHEAEAPRDAHMIPSSINRSGYNCEVLLG